jgi:hypothetical protein
MKRMIQLRRTSSKQTAAPDAPSIGEDIAESKLRSLAMNNRFENPAQGIAMKAVEMRELLNYFILRKLLFRVRKGFGPLIGNFWAIRAADKFVMRIRGEGSHEEIWLKQPPLISYCSSRHNHWI